ncbi:MAG: SIS domain-containing protein [Epsilonproteobacteria bacterium]|nr:SIS domain-containing protein [Campylobacterota bacterium]
MNEQIETYLEKLISVAQNISREEIVACANVLLKAYEEGRQIFICGNGGSAATASHFACDINKGVSYGLEKRFKVIPLTDNLATITAYTNDVNYDIIFVEQMKNFFVPGDILIGISGSGNSPNVLKAIEYANEHGGVTIGWTGFSGGKLKEMAHYSINANIDDMQVSEDYHMIFTHLMMKILRKALTGSEAYC